MEVFYFPHLFPSLHQSALLGGNMRIVVNHLTRMRPGFICVAGIDLITGRHVRPVIQGQLTRAYLTRFGGPFDIGEIVDLGSVTYAGSAPQLEDYAFSYTSAQSFAIASPLEFWTNLQRASQRTLTDIFGPELQKHGNTCATPLGRGYASLGCLIPASTPALFVHDSGKLVIHFTDGIFDVRASVTDLRLYKVDQKTVKHALIDEINHRMRTGAQVVLSVGLGRPWRKPGDSEERHWFQVNGIHLSDEPIWQDNPQRKFTFIAEIPFSLQ